MEIYKLILRMGILNRNIMLTDILLTLINIILNIITKLTIITDQFKVQIKKINLKKLILQQILTL